MSSQDCHNPDPMDTPEQATDKDKPYMVSVTMVEVEGQLFRHQTGRFPITSDWDTNYIVIFYVMDANYIKPYHIKSQHTTELVKDYEEVYQYL